MHYSRVKASLPAVVAAVESCQRKVLLPQTQPQGDSVHWGNHHL